MLHYVKILLSNDFFHLPPTESAAVTVDPVVAAADAVAMFGDATTLSPELAEKDAAELAEYYAELAEEALGDKLI